MKLLFWLSLAAAAAAAFCYNLMINMPGESYTGNVPTLSETQRESAKRMMKSVEMLASTIGERSVREPENLAKAAAWLNQSFASLGYRVSRQIYKTDFPDLSIYGVPSENIIAEKRGTSAEKEILVVGAHYDSLLGTVGADDNASGVAAVLELAQRLASTEFKRTVRFVAFVNEEPPFFRSDYMGSLRYARMLKARGEDVIGMLSIESVGFYSDAPNSQDYPKPFSLIYPNVGNFIGIVGDISSRQLVKKVSRVFRESARIPSEAGSIFSFVPGIGSSDHWAFWQAGYQGVMLTDTAPYRNPHYHERSDTADKLDYRRMCLVVDGLEAVVRSLAGSAS